MASAGFDLLTTFIFYLLTGLRPRNVLLLRYEACTVFAAFADGEKNNINNF